MKDIDSDHIIKRIQSLTSEKVSLKIPVQRSDESRKSRYACPIHESIFLEVFKEPK